jgi:nucleotide-binding universal stress UspA family protein
VQSVAPSAHYSKIVVPLDGSFHTREKLPYAIKIANAYKAEILLVGLLTSHDTEASTKMRAIVHQAEKFISSYGVDYRSEIRDSKNLATDTMNFAQEMGASLIVIMTEQEKSFSGLFLGPFAQQIVNGSTIPVLTVSPKVVTLTSSVSA